MKKLNYHLFQTEINCATRICRVIYKNHDERHCGTLDLERCDICRDDLDKCPRVFIPISSMCPEYQCEEIFRSDPFLIPLIASWGIICYFFQYSKLFLKKTCFRRDSSCSCARVLLGHETTFLPRLHSLF